MVSIQILDNEERMVKMEVNRSGDCDVVSWERVLKMILSVMKDESTAMEKRIKRTERSFAILTILVVQKSETYIASPNQSLHPK